MVVFPISTPPYAWYHIQMIIRRINDFTKIIILIIFSDCSLKSQVAFKYKSISILINTNNVNIENKIKFLQYG